MHAEGFPEHVDRFVDASGSVEILARVDGRDRVLQVGEHPCDAAQGSQVTDILCEPGRAWRLTFVLGGLVRDRSASEALSPPRADGFEGAPGAFGHVTDTRSGTTLRMQVFLLVRRSTDSKVLFVEVDGTFYLPATNLSRGEDPWHAARRIARDWFIAPLPLPQLGQVLTFPPDDEDPSWFMEIVYECVLPPGHPLGSLEDLDWRAIGDPAPRPLFADQASIWKRLKD